MGEDKKRWRYKLKKRNPFLFLFFSFRFTLFLWIKWYFHLWNVSFAVTTITIKLRETTMNHKPNREHRGALDNCLFLFTPKPKPTLSILSSLCSLLKLTNLFFLLSFFYETKRPSFLATVYSRSFLPNLLLAEKAPIPAIFSKALGSRKLMACDGLLSRVQIA